MKALLSLVPLFVLLGVAAPPAAARAEPLQEFTESGGCKLRASASSVKRQKEIAAQGNVSWNGRCAGGYIEGAGVLRHEGVEVENGRRRRFAFLLAGTARAGMRTGAWRRESMNMFEDGTTYWTSLATINYVNGAARGPTRLIPAHEKSEYSPAFRRILDALDRELAKASKNGPRRNKEDATAAPAGSLPDTPRGASATDTVAANAAAAAATPTPPSPSPSPVAAAAAAGSSPGTRTPSAMTQGVLSAPAPAPSSAPAPPTPPAAASGTAPLLIAPPPVATRAPAGRATDALRLSPAATPPAAGEPRSAAASSIFSAAASAGIAGTTDAREALLRPLAGAGKPLPPPAPPALPQQQLLEQRGACAVEQINGEVVREETIVAAATQPVRVAGWAADPHRPRAPDPPQIPDKAWIRFYDRGGGPGLLLDMPRNAERPDVARALGHPKYAHAGFRVIVAPGQLRPGDYTVAILQRIGNDLAVCGAIGRLSLR